MRRVSHAAIMLGAVLMLSAPYLRLARANRMDDYLITLRYGRNVAQGLGAVYNPGERFQGFTSPLQLGLSSSLFLLSPGPEGVPNLFGILGLFAIVTIALNVVYWVTGRLALFPVIASLAIFLSSQLLFEFAPFDTVWAIALGATAISLGRARRYALCGVATALAVLARHDASILAFLLAGSFVIARNWRGLGRFTLFLFLLTLPWYTFATAYYGSPYPKTLREKMLQGQSKHAFFNQTFTQATTKPFLWFPLGTDVLPFVAAPLALALLWGVLSLLRRPEDLSRNLLCVAKSAVLHPMTLLGVWSILQFIAYFAVLRVPPIYPWYHAYITTTILALGSLAPILFLDKAYDIVRNKSLHSRITGKDTLIVFAGCMCLTLSLWLDYEHHKRYLPEKNPGRYRYTGYRAAAEWVTAHTNPGDVIRLPEVGVFGWYCPLYIEDDASLTMDAPPIAESRFRYYVWTENHMFKTPNYVVRTCSLAASFPNKNSGNVLVFEKR